MVIKNEFYESFISGSKSLFKTIKCLLESVDIVGQLGIFKSLGLFYKYFFLKYTI